MPTLILKTRTSGPIAPPANLAPGEAAVYAGAGFTRLWIGDSAGVPQPFGEDANGFVKKAGDTMTGALTLPGSNPSADNHAARKRYVDDQVATRRTNAQNDARYLQLTGDTMTGTLTLAAKPASALQAATKNYVDDIIADYSTSTQVADAYVAKAGSTMTGALTLPGSNPTADNHAARKRYVDDQVATRRTNTQNDDRYAPTSHTHTENQITDLDRMRWQGEWQAGSYVKNDVVSYRGGVYVAAGNTVATPPAGNWRVLGRSGANVIASDTAPSSPNPGDLWARTSGQFGVYFWYVDADSSQWVSIDQASELTKGFVQKTGDTMTGQLSLPGDPTSAAHAVRKAYVDAAIAALAARVTALENAGS